MARSIDLERRKTIAQEAISKLLTQLKFIGQKESHPDKKKELRDHYSMLLKLSRAKSLTTNSKEAPF